MYNTGNIERILTGGLSCISAFLMYKWLKQVQEEKSTDVKHWHLADKELPEYSGYYLAIKKDAKGRKSDVIILYYDKAYKTWYEENGYEKVNTPVEIACWHFLPGRNEKNERDDTIVL